MNLYRKRGFFRSFTLIEVLVVMTIIVVMIAILLPALRSAKQRVNEVTCMNNLKQIGLAIMLYGEDRGYYPWGYEGGKDWSYTIQSYLQKSSGLTYGSTQHNLRSPVIQCPSRSYFPTNTVSCYSVHDRFFGNKADATHIASGAYPRPYPWNGRPSELFMVSDGVQIPGTLGGEARATVYRGIAIAADLTSANADSYYPYLLPPKGDETYINTWGARGCIRWRHRDWWSANMVFVDGHVESVNKLKLRYRTFQFVGP